MDPNGPALLQRTKNAFNAVLHLSTFVEQLSRKRSVAAWGSLTALGSLLWCLERMANSMWTQSREGHDITFLVSQECGSVPLVFSKYTCSVHVLKHVCGFIVRLWLAFSLLASNARNEPWTIVNPYKCGCPWRFTLCITCLNSLNTILGPNAKALTSTLSRLIQRHIFGFNVNWDSSWHLSATELFKLQVTRSPRQP